MKQIVPTNCQVTKLCWKYHSASLVNAGTKNNHMRQYFLKGHSLLSLNGFTPNNSQFSNKNIQISQEINSTMQVFYHGGFISKVTSKDFIHGFKT